MSVTVYIEQNWQRISHFFAVAKVVGLANALTLTVLDINNPIEVTRVTRAILAAKVVTFAVDGKSVVKRPYSGIPVCSQQALKLFATGMHSMAHLTNVAVQSLVKHNVMSSVHKLVKSASNNSSGSSIRNQELSIPQAQNETSS